MRFQNINRFAVGYKTKKRRTMLFIQEYINRRAKQEKEERDE